MRARAGAWALALVAALTVTPAAQAVPDEATATKRLYAIQANLDGAEGTRDGKGSATKNVAAQIKRYKPQVVLLQGLCLKQLYSLRKTLASSEATKGYTAVFTWKRLNFGGCNPGDNPPAADSSPATKLAGYDGRPVTGNDYGQAILVRGTLAAEPVVTILPTVPKEPRRYTSMCADTSPTGFRANSVKACVTHLNPGNGKGKEAYVANRAAQVKTMLGAIQAAPGQEVVIGGDLNATPTAKELDPLYATYLEADQADRAWFKQNKSCGPKRNNCRSGEPTFVPSKGKGPAKSKFDYLFFSENVASKPSGGAVGEASYGPGGENRHRVVVGAVDFAGA